jgi:hypothetical protein
MKFDMITRLVTYKTYLYLPSMTNLWVCDYGGNCLAMWDVVDNPNESLSFDCRYNRIPACDRDQFDRILTEWKEQIATRHSTIA